MPAEAWAVIGSVVLAVVTGIVGALFGRNNLRRDTSAANLAEAQDSQQIGAMRRYDLELERMERRNERDSARIEELLREIQRMRDADAARQLEDSKIAVERMQKQVDKALHAVAPEKIAELVRESGFLDIGKPLRAAPPKPPPMDPFHAADPYAPPRLRDPLS